MIPKVVTWFCAFETLKIANANSDKEVQDILLQDNLLVLLDRIGNQQIPTKESLEY